MRFEKIPEDQQAVGLHVPITREAVQNFAVLSGGEDRAHGAVRYDQPPWRRTTRVPQSQRQ